MVKYLLFLLQCLIGGFDMKMRNKHFYIRWTVQWHSPTMKNHWFLEKRLCGGSIWLHPIKFLWIEYQPIYVWMVSEARGFNEMRFNDHFWQCWSWRINFIVSSNISDGVIVWFFKSGSIYVKIIWIAFTSMKRYNHHSI